MVHDKGHEVQLSEPSEPETRDSSSLELAHKSSQERDSLIEQPLDLAPHREQPLGEDLASNPEEDIGFQTEHISREVLPSSVVVIILRHHHTLVKMIIVTVMIHIATPWIQKCI